MRRSSKKISTGNRNNRVGALRKQKAKQNDGVNKKSIVGSGGLKSAKNINLKYVIPIIAMVGLVGGYLVMQSFAGTYSSCKRALAANDSTYDQQCVNNSEEASVIRLYQTTLNSSPEQKDVNFWAGKLLSQEATLEQVSQQFINSDNFKNKYGQLNNDQFITLIYRQGLGREPDAAGMGYWQQKLASSQIYRRLLVSTLVQSDEMKQHLAGQVSRVLAISTFSGLDSSKQSITNAISQLVLTADNGQQCTITLSTTESWQRKDHKGSTDINVNDNGDATSCSQFVVKKLSTSQSHRASTSSKVELYESSANKDVDDREEFESLQLVTSKSDQLLRVRGAMVEIKDTKQGKCSFYRANLNGSMIAPSSMTEVSKKAC